MVKGALIMEIHNISEDIVLNSVQTIFESLKNEGNPEGLCLCEQCKLDTICYALNRIEPRYTISNRGITRIEQDWSGRQQTEADIATLVYKGIRLVNHNQRPTAMHDEVEKSDKESNEPVFDLPTIIGRIFDGDSFSPVIGATVTLSCGDKIVTMRNRNWQNPFTLIENTPGAFSFWPAHVKAEAEETHRSFEYSLKIEAPGYEPLVHVFNIPVISSVHKTFSYAMDRTTKLPDLFIFKPEESDQHW